MLLGRLDPMPQAQQASRGTGQIPCLREGPSRAPPPHSQGPHLLPVWTLQ